MKFKQVYLTKEQGYYIVIGFKNADLDTVLKRSSDFDEILDYFKQRKNSIKSKYCGFKVIYEPCNNVINGDEIRKTRKNSDRVVSAANCVVVEHESEGVSDNSQEIIDLESLI